MLAERAGITLESSPVVGDSRGPSKTDLLEVHAWAEDLFLRTLRVSPAALDYLAARGMSTELADRFRIGFAPPERGWLMAQAKRVGFGLDVLENAGLIVRPEDNTGPARERFRDRLMFPIHDLQGRTIGFGGRILPATEQAMASQGKSIAKYLNSPETLLFQKRKVLYAADLARAACRASGWVAVVEGYTDVIAAHQAGLGNIVGTLGTALGDDHLVALRRLADRVVLIFDGDEAGQKAADRSLELFLGHEVDLRVLSLPGGLDPCDFLLREGADAFRKLIDGAVDPLAFLLARSRNRFDFGSLDGASRAADWVLSILARIPVGHLSSLKLAKALDTLSHRLGVDVNTLRGKLNEFRRRIPRDRPTDVTIRPTPMDSEGRVSMRVDEPEARHSPTFSAPIRPAELDQIDREFIEILLNDPESAGSLASRVTVSMLKDAPLRAIYQVFQDLRDEGETPGFERIVLRLDDPNLRAFAAGLLLPIESGPLETKRREAPWSERLQKLVPAIRERERQQRIRDIKKALVLMEADVSADPDARLALQVEYRRLLNQRPDTKSDAS